MSQPPSEPGERFTRIIPLIMLMLIVLFVLQMLLVESTGVRVTLSVILMVVMGAVLGWLVASLRRDHGDRLGR